MPVAMKTLMLILPVLALLSCSQNGEPGIVKKWEVVPDPIIGERPHVEPYEVEFLPMLPDNPHAIIVGRFFVHDDAALQFGNEAMMQAIKRRAAAMGGNTIVYPHTGITEVTVAYVPIEQSVHGGDEY